MLRRRKRVDAGPVLRADVVALAHALGRVVVLPKGFQELLVGDFLRIVDDEHDFVVAGPPAAHLVISGIRRMAAGIADGGYVDAVAELPELALCTPEAAEPKH